MATLYIIGNGFDLWHGLPTSYDDFYEYAKETLDELESYFRLDTIKTGPWCDFESSLGTYDWSLFYGTHDHTDVTAECFKPSEAYGLQDELDEQTDILVRRIEEQFNEWVDGIDVSAAPKLLQFDHDARFLTFNYTSTIQLVYGVDSNRVLHIHGRVDRDRLIFGHGATIEEEPELDENGDSNRTMFSDAESAAKYPFYDFQKPTDEVIGKNREYFESLGGITAIAVIGHSLSDVDLPYFEELAKRTVGRCWLVYCYTELDESHHVRQLVKCGISNETISYMRISKPIGQDLMPR
jgi:hypothetical protein